MGEAESRWMTYRALADELGISLRAAEARARRNVRMGRWRHRIDNEPPKAAQVLVPPADLEAMREGTAWGKVPLTAGDPVGDAVPHTVIGLVTELHQRAEAAEARTRGLASELATQRERAGRAEGERDTLQEALRATQATAHQRATEITAVMGRVAEGLEHIRQTQAIAAEAVAVAKAEREAALAKVEETAQRAGEAEARAVEASRRAEAAEGRLEEAQRLPAETTPPPDMAELEAAQARATEAERQAAEAEHKANTANKRLDRFQRERITRSQEAAARASEAAELANLEAEAQRPWWQRIFRRRRRP